MELLEACKALGLGWVDVLSKFIAEIEKDSEVPTEDKEYKAAYVDGWSDCIITIKNKFLPPNHQIVN